MINVKKYSGKIIHLTYGGNDYIGDIKVLSEEGWYRIFNPCSVNVVQIQTPKGPGEKIFISAIQQDDDRYEKFVDIFIPPEMIIEIRVLNPDGAYMEIYNRQIARKKSKLIHLPAGASLN